MTARPRWLRPLIVSLVLAGLILPLIAYWLAIGRIPSVTATEAKALLGTQGSASMLVDVRSASAYTERHLEGADNWPYDQIMAASSPEQVPAALRGRRLLLLCDSGILSSLATRHLRTAGIADATNVDGGMQAWIGTADKPCGLSLCRLRAAGGATADLPYKESPWYEQWAAVISGFVIKPTYMLLSLVLVAVLWRSTSPDLAAFRWAMIFFFIGEAWCAANYLATEHESVLFEFLHSYGMVLCFAFTTFATFEAMDRLFFKYSDPKERCAAIGLCRGCIKHTQVPCGLKRCFLLAIPMVIIIALMPFTADLHSVSYNTRILGAFYNYAHPVVHQVYEIRFCPAAAIGLLVVALTALAVARNEPVLKSKVLFAAGAGLLGFGLFRWFLFAPYTENLVWFGFWEEITELIFVVGACAVLWIFRHGLFRKVGGRNPREEPSDSPGILPGEQETALAPPAEAAE